ncbi:hypothetical protein H9P43_000697 [Blastocladiella emersonii ATCC 22665]|nr:hypothetical protein H9P43_000697 [Blastocladiella emersonii ATCC 22665]
MAYHDDDRDVREVLEEVLRTHKFPHCHCDPGGEGCERCWSIRREYIKLQQQQQQTLPPRRAPVLAPADQALKQGPFKQPLHSWAYPSAKALARASEPDPGLAPLIKGGDPCTLFAVRVAGWIRGNCPAARVEFDSAAGCPRVWVCDEFSVYIVPSNAFRSPLPLHSVRATTTQPFEQPAESTASLPSETASEAAPPRIDSIDLMADGLGANVTQSSAGDVEPMQCDMGDPARQRKRPRSRSLSPAAVAAGPPLVAKRSRTALPLAADSLLSPLSALALTGANSLPTPPSGPGLAAPTPPPPAAPALLPPVTPAPLSMQRPPVPVFNPSPPPVVTSPAKPAAPVVTSPAAPTPRAPLVALTEEERAADMEDLSDDDEDDAAAAAAAIPKPRPPGPPRGTEPRSPPRPRSPAPRPPASPRPRSPAPPRSPTPPRSPLSLPPRSPSAIASAATATTARIVTLVPAHRRAHILAYLGVENPTGAEPSAQLFGALEDEDRELFDAACRVGVAFNKRTWDYQLEFAAQIFEPWLLWRWDGLNRRFITWFSGTFKTDGYALHLIMTKGGVPTKIEKSFGAARKAKSGSRSRGSDNGTVDQQEAEQEIGRQGDQQEANEEYESDEEELLETACGMVDAHEDDANDEEVEDPKEFAVKNVKIRVRRGQYVIVIDPGVGFFISGLAVTYKQAKRMRDRRARAQRSAHADSADFKQEVLDIATNMDTEGKATYAQITSAQFQYQTGAVRAAKDHVDAAKNWGVEPALVELSEAYMSRDQDKILEAELKHAAQLQEFGDRKSLKRRRFFSGSRRQKWWSDLANSFHDAVVLIGHANNFGAIKKSHKGPVKEMIREMRKRGVDIHVVNEAYTSKRCCACAAVAADNGKDHKSCGKAFNRDRNAAMNILLFNSHLLHFDEDDEVAEPSASSSPSSSASASSSPSSSASASSSPSSSAPASQSKLTTNAKSPSTSTSLVRPAAVTLGNTVVSGVRRVGVPRATAVAEAKRLKAKKARAAVRKASVLGQTLDPSLLESEDVQQQAYRRRRKRNRATRRKCVLERQSGRNASQVL